ncbi:nucleotidyltransferase [Acidovorax sp. Root219]|uniref:nucleotidyltransferase domain-containing protein n=1 Tax=Acidovorax sp. Root219 TaxID=1736493 RepID=UPI0009EBCB7A|nr:nucleotidyltransferase [Acidovorax sp. Root219]
MTTNPPVLSKRISDALAARKEGAQWESFIVSMLQKLELSPSERAKAVKRYDELARHIARKLSVSDVDVHVVVQGSMRTQTTTAMWGNTKFDLDIVVKLSSSRFSGLKESEGFFQEFGLALRGVPEAGEPVAKNRCWRLQYPGEPFYFDVTPAIPLSAGIVGTDLRVRDPKTIWSPSNPEEFASWFCKIAEGRFPFQRQQVIKAADARTQVDPVPTGRVGIDDILRRTVQLVKLHRDNYYRGLSEHRRDGMPISVILVTLASSAFRDMLAREATSFGSAIEVAVEIVDRLPKYIDRSRSKVQVMNPALSGPVGENFADRWNGDGGVRSHEFSTWHAQLVTDLEALFADQHTKKDEGRVKRIFGEHGVQAWKDGLAAGGLMEGLLNTLPAEPRSNPQNPVPTGSRNQLA